MSEKPHIFISHASIDQHLASVLQQQLALVFDVPNQSVFRSTDAEAIAPAKDWFDAINEALDLANALVVIVSSSSMKSIWVGYEIGYFWHKTGAEKRIYPLVIPNTEITGPIQRLQYKSLVTAEDVGAFFNTLCAHLGTGNSDLVNTEAVVQAAVDVNIENIKRTLKDYVELEVEPGQQLYYNKIDRELGLPSGSAQKYFPQIVPQNWRVDEERRNSAGTALYPPPSPSNPPGDPF